MEVRFYKSGTGRSPVEEFISALPAADKARFLDVYDGIRAHGLECPRVIFKPLEGKLWEIKFSSTGGGFRVAYVLIQGPAMVWLHAFRKTSQKTLRTDLELARKRAKEILSYEK